jgi:MFS family permease
VCAGTWLNAADGLVTATIMPSAAKDIGGYGAFGWAVAIFMLGAIAASASAGRLTLWLGLRRAMAMAGCAYALGCVAGAVAPSVGAFLVGRLLQGAGGGWVAGLCYVATTRLFPERLWQRVLSALAGIWGAATLVSPLIGGLFAQAGFWRGAFLFFAVQGVGFVAAAWALVGAAEPGPDELAAKAAPVAQLVAIAIAVALIGVAGEAQSPAQAAALGLAGVGGLGVFLWVDRRAPANLLPRAAGDVRSAAGAGLLMVFSLEASTVSYGVYGAALMQRLYGATPVMAGYVLCLVAAAWTAAALGVAGRTVPAPYIRLGAVLVPLSVAAMSLAMPGAGLVAVGACSLMQGAGFGVAWAFAAGRIVAGSPPRERALASAAVPTAQMMGTAVGAAAAGAIAGQLGLSHGIDVAHARIGGFWLFAAFAPLALVGLGAGWRLASPRCSTATE